MLLPALPSEDKARNAGLYLSPPPVVKVWGVCAWRQLPSRRPSCRHLAVPDARRGPRESGSSPCLLTPGAALDLSRRWRLPQRPRLPQLGGRPVAPHAGCSAGGGSGPAAPGSPVSLEKGTSGLVFWPKKRFLAAPASPAEAGPGSYRCAPPPPTADSAGERRAGPSLGVGLLVCPPRHRLGAKGGENRRRKCRSRQSSRSWWPAMASARRPCLRRPTAACAGGWPSAQPHWKVWRDEGHIINNISSGAVLTYFAILLAFLFGGGRPPGSSGRLARRRGAAGGPGEILRRRGAGGARPQGERPARAGRGRRGEKGSARGGGC